MSFDTLGLSPILLSALKKSGYTEPTSVQSASIPQALEGHDLIVSAQTGSGKTAAFMLPSLNRIANMPANKGAGVQVLVLTPTRELAQQVAEATKTYGQGIQDLRIATVVGGMPYGAQIKMLSRRVDVLVATPGRLIDHLNAKRVNLSQVHTLILDEADRMLDMGFIEDIESIVAKTPASRQTLMFSATFEGSVARLAADMLNEPKRIDISNQKQKHTNITQTLLYADDAAHKMRLLDHLLRDASVDQAIVFTATKRGADALADRLDEEGFSASALHGDMNQRQRTRTLTQLQRGRLRVLVATDVAARGIDVQGISHAINYDLPMQAEDYVHRIGRTGRAGRSGLAFTLATHSEKHKIRRIEHFIGQTLNAETIEGLEPTKTAESSRGRKSGKGGGRNGGGERRFNKGKDQSRSGFAMRKGDQERSFDKPRAEFGDRPARAERPAFGDRPARTERPSFGDRPARAANGDRPSYGDRPARAGFSGDRPSFGDRPAKAGFGDRPARAGFGGDRPAREGRPASRGSDRPFGKGNKESFSRGKKKPAPRAWA
ncbi:MAG: DEAD/DEAH box helicase [Advenella sp.]